MNKEQLIRDICSRHPSYGVEKGYSWYTGGMKDTGDWYVLKMLGESEEELRSFLNEIIKEETKPVPELSEQDKADMNIFYNNGRGVIYSEYHRKQWSRFLQDQEQKLFFSPSPTTPSPEE